MGYTGTMCYLFTYVFDCNQLFFFFLKCYVCRKRKKYENEGTKKTKTRRKLKKETACSLLQLCFLYYRDSSWGIPAGYPPFPLVFIYCGTSQHYVSKTLYSKQLILLSSNH